MGKIVSLLDMRLVKERKERIEQIHEMLRLLETTGTILSTGNPAVDEEMNRPSAFGPSEHDEWWKRLRYQMWLVTELDYLNWPIDTYEQSKQRAARIEKRGKLLQELLRSHTEHIKELLIEQTNGE